MTIDLDQSKTNQPLSFRERAAIRILLVIFEMIIPAKYPHQLKELSKTILGE